MMGDDSHCCSTNLGVVLWPLLTLYSVVYWVLTILLLALFAALYQVVWLVGGRGHGIARVQAVWGRLQVAMALSTVHVEGRENLPKEGGCVLVANHRSYVDIFAINAVVGRPVRWVLKESLLHYPVLGLHLRTAGGAVALDRGNPRAAARVLLEAAKDLGKGDVFVVFPEGTRSSEGMLPFKSGAFALVQRSGVPLVPVAIRGTGRILPARSLLIHPFKRVSMTFLPPMTGQALDIDREALSNEVRSRLISELRESPVECAPVEVSHGQGAGSS
ncbi:MAG: lysophospholipid acyltransferase family protein [Planctomycetota bacterium]